MSASQVIRIRARNGQSERLGLRLQQLVEPGLEAPGCLEYQVRRDALEPDLWLVCSQWREAQQMFDYLAGGIQQVFAEVLWRSLAASLERRLEQTQLGADDQYLLAQPEVRRVLLGGAAP